MNVLWIQLVVEEEDTPRVVEDVSNYLNKPHIKAGCIDAASLASCPTAIEPITTMQ